MINAKDLMTKQKERELLKYKTFDKIYFIIEKKIILASNSNFYYIWYKIPEFIYGAPLFNHSECIQVITSRLTKNNFKVEQFDNNILLISWFPEK